MFETFDASINEMHEKCSRVQNRRCIEMLLYVAVTCGTNWVLNMLILNLAISSNSGYIKKIQIKFNIHISKFFVLVSLLFAIYNRFAHLKDNKHINYQDRKFWNTPSKHKQ